MSVTIKAFSPGGTLISSGFNESITNRAKEVETLLAPAEGDFEIHLNADGNINRLIGNDSLSLETIDKWNFQLTDYVGSSQAYKYKAKEGKKSPTFKIGTSDFTKNLKGDFFTSLTNAVVNYNSPRGALSTALSPYGININAGSGNVNRETGFEDWRITNRENALALVRAMKTGKPEIVYNTHTNRSETFTPNKRDITAGNYLNFINTVEQQEKEMVFDPVVVGLNKSTNRVQEMLESDSWLDNAIGHGALSMKTALLPEDYETMGKNPGVFALIGLLEVPQRLLATLTGQSFFDPRSNIFRPIMDWVNKGAEEEDQKWLKENRQKFFFTDDELGTQAKFFESMDKIQNGTSDTIKRELSIIADARHKEGAKATRLKTDELLSLTRFINQIQRYMDDNEDSDNYNPMLIAKQKKLISLLVNRQEDLGDTIAPPGHWARDVTNGILNLAGDPGLLFGAGAIGFQAAKGVAVKTGLKKFSAKALQKQGDDAFELGVRAADLDNAEGLAEATLKSDGIDGVSARFLKKNPAIYKLKVSAKKAYNKGADWFNEKFLHYDDMVLNGDVSANKIYQATKATFIDPGPLTKYADNFINNLIDNSIEKAAAKMTGDSSFVLSATKDATKDKILKTYGIRHLRTLLTKMHKNEPGIFRELSGNLADAIDSQTLSKLIKKSTSMTDVEKAALREKAQWFGSGGPARWSLAARDGADWVKNLGFVKTPLRIGKTTNYESQIIATRTWDNTAHHMSENWFSSKKPRSKYTEQDFNNSEVYLNANKINDSIQNSSGLIEAKIALESIESGETTLADLSGKIFKSDDDVFQYNIMNSSSGAKAIEVKVNKNSEKYKALSAEDKAKYDSNARVIPYVDNESKSKILATISENNKVTSLDATKQTHLDSYSDAQTRLDESQYSVSNTGAVFNKKDPKTILGFVDEKTINKDGLYVKVWDEQSFTPYSEGVIQKQMADDHAKQLINAMQETSKMNEILARSGSLSSDDSKDIVNGMLTIVSHQYHDSDKKKQIMFMLEGVLKKEPHYVEFLANIKNIASTDRASQAKNLLRQGMLNNAKAGRLGLTELQYNRLAEMTPDDFEAYKISLKSNPLYGEHAPRRMLENLWHNSRKGEPYNPMAAVDDYMETLSPGEIEEFSNALLDATQISEGMTLTTAFDMKQKATAMTKKAGMYSNNPNGTQFTQYNQDLKTFEDLVGNKIRNHMRSSETVGRTKSAQVSPDDAALYSKLSDERAYKAGVLNTWASRFGDYGGKTKGASELAVAADRIQGDYLNKGLKEFEENSWRRKNSVYNQLVIFDDVMEKIYKEQGKTYVRTSDKMRKVAEARFRGQETLLGGGTVTKNIDTPNQITVDIPVDEEAIAARFKQDFNIGEMDDGGTIEASGSILGGKLKYTRGQSKNTKKAAKLKDKQQTALSRRRGLLKNGYKALYYMYTNPVAKLSKYAGLAERGYNDRENQKLAKYFSSENEFEVLKDFENGKMTAWSDFINGVKGFFGTKSYTPLRVGSIVADPMSTIKTGVNGVKKNYTPKGGAKIGIKGFETESGNFVLLQKPWKGHKKGADMDLNADWKINVYKDKAIFMKKLRKVHKGLSDAYKNGNINFNYDSGFNNKYGWKQTVLDFKEDWLHGLSIMEKEIKNR